MEPATFQRPTPERKKINKKHKCIGITSQIGIRFWQRVKENNYYNQQFPSFRNKKNLNEFAKAMYLSSENNLEKHEKFLNTKDKIQTKQRFHRPKPKENYQGAWRMLESYLHYRHVERSAPPPNEYIVSENPEERPPFYPCDPSEPWKNKYVKQLWTDIALSVRISSSVQWKEKFPCAVNNPKNCIHIWKPQPKPRPKPKSV